MTEQQPRTWCERTKERRLDAAVTKSTSNEERLDAIIARNVNVELLQHWNGPRTFRRFEFNPVPDQRMANVGRSR